MWSLEGQFFSYLGTGFGGTITGVGGSIAIIDDPIKTHLEAFNDAFLDAQYQWYTDTSRLEEDAIQILNFTRWNSRDLIGRVLSDEDGGDWYVLKMKACLDEQTKEMLCPELFSFTSYLKKKAKMSLAIFMANYQQEPVDLVNSLYKDFKEYDDLPRDDEGNLLLEEIKSYCDTADQGDDFLCNIIYGVYRMEAYVLDMRTWASRRMTWQMHCTVSVWRGRISRAIMAASGLPDPWNGSCARSLVPIIPISSRSFRVPINRRGYEATLHGCRNIFIIPGTGKINGMPTIWR